MHEKVIWTHPKGRFEVVEHTCRAMDGRIYHVRECRPTPQHDMRGLACDAAAQPISVDPALCAAPKPAYGTVSGADIDAWCRWYRNGKSILEIAEQTGRNEKTVAAKLKKRGLLMADEEWEAVTQPIEQSRPKQQDDSQLSDRERRGEIVL